MVFWPPATILVMALTASLYDFSGFLATVTTANQWILSHFDWLFSLASFAAVILLAWVFVSPLGRVRIGGPDAKPILSRWNWFAITLCTTIAIGILFWGAAEPMFHVNYPPEFAHADAHSPEASRFALASMFMHWSITPYAIYAAPALAFALAYYNLGYPYSLSGPLSVLFGRHAGGRNGEVFDAIALFALVAGVAAALGAGVMTLAGGLDVIAGLDDSPLLRFSVTGSIVTAYVVSSVSGLQRGIRFLSDINTKFFFLLSIFVLLTGPTLSILSLGSESFLSYMREFIPRSLSLGERAGNEWTRDWTVFNFAQWLAWAPITALFLGRISVGYTVREFLIFNLAGPAVFSMIWMTIFGGAAISIDDANGGALSTALAEKGPEAVVYALFDALPLAGVVVIAFVGLTFISFVTAMDSNTHSIANVCLKDDAPEHHKKPAALRVKIFWGLLVGAVAWVMTSTSGIDGVRMLSNLGGLPGLFILIAMIAVLIRMRIARMDELIRAQR
ncbi:MAG: BCCT family transporter [Parvularculaceae bacterium]